MENLGLPAVLANIVDSKGKLTKNTSRIRVVKQQQSVPLQLKNVLAKVGLQWQKYKPQSKLQIA